MRDVETTWERSDKDGRDGKWYKISRGNITWATRGWREVIRNGDTKRAAYFTAPITQLWANNSEVNRWKTKFRHAGFTRITIRTLLTRWICRHCVTIEKAEAKRNAVKKFILNLYNQAGSFRNKKKNTRHFLHASVKRSNTRTREIGNTCRVAAYDR